MRIAIVSNGNVFSTLMARRLFQAGDVDVAGAVVVRLPPGRGGPVARLARLARRTGGRYAAHKLGTIAVPRAYAAASGRPVFLQDLCRRHGARWLSVESANGPVAIEFLERLRPDVLVSISAPQRLDPEVLRIPSLAAINIHWALLPRYAGIAPYFWVLRHGEERTGLTVHVMAPEVDVGPILRQREVELRPDDTSLSVQLRLTRLGGEQLLASVRELPGSLERAREQDLKDRSYFTWPTRDDVRALGRRGGRLAWWRDYRTLVRDIRGP
jgi:methionyl-tRNA formyltransferase